MDNAYALPVEPTGIHLYNPQATTTSTILSSLEKKPQSASDSVEFDFSSAGKAIVLSEREIVEKLNELLAEKLPDGIESLSPEEVTPEATAERIVTGATSFFDVFARQNPELEGEELLSSFMDTIRSGIETGYGQAYETLDGLGAFEFEGVKEGIQKTKGLIEEKLQAFEAMKREQLGIVSEIADNTTASLLAEGGRQVAEQ